MQIDRHIYIIIKRNKSSRKSMVFRVNMPLKHVIVLHNTARFAYNGWCFRSNY